MKRLVLRICVFLLLGAIVNVAVAFALWRWGERPLSGTFESIDYWQSRSPDANEMATWQILARDDWPAAPQTTLHQTKFGMHYSKLVAVKNGFDVLQVSHDEWKLKAQDRSFFTIDSATCGWPIPFAATSEAQVTSGMPPKFISWDDAWLIGRLRIPNRIGWPGLAINTVFYAAVLWGLYAVPFVLRRRRRIKRGLCPKCAYPAGESERCTECGAAVTPSAAVSMTKR